MGAVRRALLHRDVAAALQRQAVQRMLHELREEAVLRPDFSVLVAGAQPWKGETDAAPAGNQCPAANGILVARYVSRFWPHVVH